MSSDIRAALERLTIMAANELDMDTPGLWAHSRASWDDAIAAARAALAAVPEGDGPSNEELVQLAIDTRLYCFQATAGDPIQYEMTEQQVHAFARAVLSRWGRPAAPSAPLEGEVGELVAALEADAECAEVEHYDLCNMTADQMRRAATLLSQLSAAAPAVVPVAVSERLPGPADCDAEGRCWWLKERSNPEHDLLLPTWHLQRQGPAGTRFFRFTHWLPAQALPLPAPQGGEVGK